MTSVGVVILTITKNQLMGMKIQESFNKNTIIFEQLVNKFFESWYNELVEDV